MRTPAAGEAEETPETSKKAPTTLVGAFSAGGVFLHNQLARRDEQPADVLARRAALAPAGARWERLW